MSPWQKRVGKCLLTCHRVRKLGPLGPVLPSRPCFGCRGPEWVAGPSFLRESLELRSGLQTLPQWAFVMWGAV